MGVGVALAVVLAGAALVVSLTQWSENSAATVTPGASSPPGSTGATAEADKALCTDIAPLVEESSARKNAFAGLGPYGSPERDAGVPAFVADTKKWVMHAQEVLDKHAQPPRYAVRTLQRYIDDMRLIAANLRPGPEARSISAGWDDSLIALAGPFEVCAKLGVPLW
jgi:hypothetical protein